MADSGARGSHAADPPAGRHARPDGQAVGRDHRDADHRELPRGSHRCSSTSSRRTARARVSPTPRSRRRTPVTSRAVSSTSRRTPSSPSSTAARSTASRSTQLDRGRRDHRAARRPHPRPRRARGRRRPAHRRGARAGQRRRSTRTTVKHRSRTPASTRSKIRSVLTCQTRRGICVHVLRPRPGARLHGQHRRGGRRHRRPVDRRAGHAAHDAHVPHRWRGGARQDRAVARSRRAPRARCSSSNAQHRRSKKDGTHRGHEPPRRARHRRRDRPRARALPPALRRRAQGRATASSVKRASCWPSGIRSRCRSSPRSRGIVKYGDIIEGVTDAGAARRGHRPVAQGRHRVARTPTSRPRISLKDRRRARRSSSRTASTTRATSCPVGANIVAPRRRPHRGRRRHRQDPARDHQDQGHHRRSAARGRAVRGPQAEGPRGHLPRSTAWSPSARTPRASARSSSRRSPTVARRPGARVPDPQGQAHPGAARATACAPASR